MKKRPTLTDIARVTEVSVMTVSRAINNKPGVSEEMRRNIMDTATKMGYHPNPNARSLTLHKTATIGLIVPDNTNPFFAQIARGVEDVAYENYYNIFLVNTAEDQEREIRAFDSLWQKGIDGIILCSSRLSSEDLETQILRIPAMVVLNRDIKNHLPNLVTINVNDQRGARLAIEHLVARGCNRIAFINGPSNSTSARRRLEGYRAGLLSAGLRFDEQMVERCTPDIEGGRAAARILLDRCPDVDAIFAFNDLVAIGALQFCQEAGKHIPEDVAIIGVDNTPLATVIRPQLTTLHVNLRHVGSLAMRTLLDLVAGEAPSGTFQIEPKLFVRDSA